MQLKNFLSKTPPVRVVMFKLRSNDRQGKSKRFIPYTNIAFKALEKILLEPNFLKVSSLTVPRVRSSYNHSRVGID